MAGGGATTSLLETPTWALAIVCFVFISLGIGIEHSIHLICHWLKKHRKNGLFEAVEKLKSNLMLLGFMSLILAATQRLITRICVTPNVARSMLPCRKITYTNTTTTYGHDQALIRQERILAMANASYTPSDHCASKGMDSFISANGLTELNIFIFVLAVMQIAYSVATMALGRAKMKRWKQWEIETHTVEYMAANDPDRFRLTRQTTFGRRHTSNCTQTSAQLWIKCFFRQFFRSVAKVDYLTLRHGFISAHLSTTNKTFDFRRYIQRSLEDDFKVVVGISPFMWLVVVIFLMVDVHGWNVYLWVSLLPLILVLAIGTKLEVVVAKMALKLKDENQVVRGALKVEPDDGLFWFNDPHFILTLLHFTLFMNAFELAFFIWVTVQFGISSCYHERTEIIVIRVVLAVMVQVLCSYITLPLYALVTQMGSKYKVALLEEHTVQALKVWHKEVRKKRQHNNNVNKHEPNSPNTPRSISTNSSTVATPTHHHHHHHHDSSSYHKRSPTLSDLIIESRDMGEEIVQECPHDRQDEIVVRVENDQIYDQDESNDDNIVEISVVTDDVEIHEIDDVDKSAVCIQDPDS